jgi:tetratricopeptide (TPR) repeat protein
MVHTPREPDPEPVARTRDGEEIPVPGQTSGGDCNKGVALNVLLRNIPALEAFTGVNRCAVFRSFGDMPLIPPSRSSHPAPRRRTRIPPALTRGAESMPAIGILDEVPGDLGVLLWRSVRNVALWAATPPASRGALFAGGAADVREADLSRVEVDAEMVAPLSVMVRLLESPGGMDVGRVVNACRRISGWAEQRGALATALEFMQAAALTAPQVAAIAYAVGRLARRRAEYDRAESWFGRAVIQARRSRDWRSYALAFSGLGNLNVQKGNFPTAKRAHVRCLRAALRHDLTDLQGIAYHDLFVTEIETGAGTSADTFAEQAFRAYGEGNPRVPRLAYDVAYHWMLEGFFGDALRLAQALERHFDAPAEQALVLGLVARSAGGAGDRAGFERARRAVEGLLAGAGEDAAARSLLGMAYGAASLQEWQMARDYATRALHLATERREGRVVLAAEAALESVTAGLTAQANPPRPSATRLADAFVEALTRPAGGALVGA